MNVPEELLRPQTLRLPDGRRLAWYEFGDPAGTPCIYTTGTPTSGLAGAFYHEDARASAVRWISPDKPGYGQSDYQARRTLLDWPADVAALADHLRLERFAAVGESGGGPHALALCHALPRQVTAGLVLASLAPPGGAAQDGMMRANRLMFWLAARHPALLWLPFAIARHKRLRQPPSAARHESGLSTRLAAMPPADRALCARPEIMGLLDRAGVEALRPGVRGAIQEIALLIRPWNFELSEVTVPIELWHGTEDRNVPIAMARALAAALPRSRLHVVEGAGHLASMSCHAQIMEVIRRAATADGRTTVAALA
jgi:pimeloyl-ACP methyl ester carboxylesterase